MFARRYLLLLGLASLLVFPNPGTAQLVNGCEDLNHSTVWTHRIKVSGLAKTCEDVPFPPPSATAVGAITVAKHQFEIAADFAETSCEAIDGVLQYDGAVQTQPAAEECTLLGENELHHIFADVACCVPLLNLPIEKPKPILNISEADANDVCKYYFGEDYVDSPEDDFGIEKINASTSGGDCGSIIADAENEITQQEERFEAACSGSTKFFKPYEPDYCKLGPSIFEYAHNRHQYAVCCQNGLDDPNEQGPAPNVDVDIDERHVDLCHDGERSLWSIKTLETGESRSCNDFEYEGEVFIGATELAKELVASKNELSRRFCQSLGATHRGSSQYFHPANSCSLVENSNPKIYSRTVSEYVSCCLPETAEPPSLDLDRLNPNEIVSNADFACEFFFDSSYEASTRINNPLRLIVAEVEEEAGEHTCAELRRAAGYLSIEQSDEFRSECRRSGGKPKVFGEYLTSKCELKGDPAKAYYSIGSHGLCCARKVSPHACAPGVFEEDNDGDGIVDCLDPCLDDADNDADGNGECADFFPAAGFISVQTFSDTFYSNEQAAGSENRVNYFDLVSGGSIELYIEIEGAMEGSCEVKDGNGNTIAVGTEYSSYEMDSWVYSWVYGYGSLYVESAPQYFELGSHSFTVTCDGLDGSTLEESVSYVVYADMPYVNYLDVYENGSNEAYVSFDVSYADNCTLSHTTPSGSTAPVEVDGWHEEYSFYYYASTYLFDLEPGRHTFTVECSGPGGSISEEAYLEIAMPDAPTVSYLEASDWGYGEANVYLDADNAESCMLSFTDSSGVTTEVNADGYYDEYSYYFSSSTYVYLEPGAYELEVSCDGPGGSTSSTTSLTMED